MEAGPLTARRPDRSRHAQGDWTAGRALRSRDRQGARQCNQDHQPGASWHSRRPAPGCAASREETNIMRSRVKRRPCSSVPQEKWDTAVTLVRQLNGDGQGELATVEPDLAITLAESERRTKRESTQEAAADEASPDDFRIAARRDQDVRRHPGTGGDVHERGSDQDRQEVDPGRHEPAQFRGIGEPGDLPDRCFGLRTRRRASEARETDIRAGNRTWTPRFLRWQNRPTGRCTGRIRR